VAHIFNMPHGEGDQAPPTTPIHPTAALVLVTIVVAVIALHLTIRTGEVKGTEVGVLVNNITGDVQVLDKSGTTIYNGLYKTFGKIDTTVQKLEMEGDDRVRIKTRDGSDVQLAVTIQYQVDPTKALKVIQDSGLGEAYKAKWARDYSRSICRNVFGELSTEEFYDTAKRTAKAIQSQQILQDRLGPHGINMIGVIPKEFSFYAEYEEKIRDKKRADQAVEEQRSQANAATQVKERRRVEETKNKQVAVAGFDGQMKELVNVAEADADRIKKQADAYAVTKKLEAEAEFYKRDKNANAILATKTAEAEGAAKIAEALKGEGGVNIVKLEYAKRLISTLVTGQPFSRTSVTERFEHTTQAPAAAASPAESSTAKEGVTAKGGRK
jgi:regulator of protease activity HflC (stomatin/prohibitin superfamily)